MSMTFDEAIQVWAARELEKAGYGSVPGRNLTVENTVIYDGYCETCSYEYAGYIISNPVRGGGSVSIRMDFSELVRELSSIQESYDG